MKYDYLAPDVMAFEEVRRFVNQDSVLAQERLLDAQHEAEKLALKRDSLEKAETQTVKLSLKSRILHSCPRAASALPFITRAPSLRLAPNLSFALANASFTTAPALK
jgi:hypothetical protein